MADMANTPDDPPVDSSIPAQDAEPHVVVDDDLVAVRVRRAPRYATFLVLGAILGIIVALVLTFAFDGSGDVSPNTGVVYSQTQVFGFLALVFVAVGLVVGGAVALILDRVMSRRSREVVADRERAHLED